MLPPEDDLGLGTRTGPNRGVNKDGSFNLQRIGLPRFRPYELYHELITMGGFKFLSLLLVGFMVTNVIFAAIYLGIGMEHFIRPGDDSLPGRALDALFFSSQTLTTVGYGHISPKSHWVSAVAALESLVGLLSFALATGLLYGRFSRPKAKLGFSPHCLIAPYRGITAFMFRLVNLRSSQLLEVEATLTLALDDPATGARRFARLELERSQIHLFPSNWTVVHPFDETSPLFGKSETDLRKARAEIIVLIKAFDDTFSQTIFARTSYRADEFLWGAKFLPMTTQLEGGMTLLDLNLLDATVPAVLPPRP